MALLSLASFNAIRVVVNQVGRALTRPAEFYASAAEWACGGQRSQWCDRVDVTTAERLRARVSPGQTLISDSYLEQDNPEFRDTVLASFSGLFVVGHGIKVSTPTTSRWQSYFRPAGSRTIAFWQTLDPQFLEDFRPTYLFLNPGNLMPEAYARLRARPELSLAVREEDSTRGGVREVYRLFWTSSKPAPLVPTDLVVRATSFPARLEVDRFYWVGITLETAAASTFRGPIRMSYRVFNQNVRLDSHDEVRQTISLVPRGDRRLQGVFAFVAPYEKGDHRIEFLTWQGESAVSLRNPQGDVAQVTIRTE